MSWARSGGHAEEALVGDEVAWPDAQDGAAAREMIQKGHALGDVEGVMIGQADHRGAQADSMGAHGGLGQGHLGHGHGFPAPRVMLADKEFIEVERVGVLDERDVALEGERGMLRGMMYRHHKEGKFHGYPLIMMFTSRPGTTIILMISLPSV